MGGMVSNHSATEPAMPGLMRMVAQLAQAPEMQGMADQLLGSSDDGGVAQRSGSRTSTAPNISGLMQTMLPMMTQVRPAKMQHLHSVLAS